MLLEKEDCKLDSHTNKYIVPPHLNNLRNTNKNHRPPPNTPPCNGDCNRGCNEFLPLPVIYPEFKPRARFTLSPPAHRTGQSYYGSGAGGWVLCSLSNAASQMQRCPAGGSGAGGWEPLKCTIERLHHRVQNLEALEPCCEG